MQNQAREDVYLERVDHTQNMARYYCISLQQDLFGQLTLVKNWGRIGTTGRTAIASFSDPAQVIAAHRKLLERKVRRGYRLILAGATVPADGPVSAFLGSRCHTLPNILVPVSKKTVDAMARDGKGRRQGVVSDAPLDYE